MSEQPEFEELEQIPWSALAATPQHDRLRWLVGIAGMVVALGFGLLLARWLLSGEEATVVTLPPVAVDDAAVPPAEAVGEPGVAAAASQPVSPSPAIDAAPSLYSEADLMAVAPDVEARLAVFHAEGFVRDFFTDDGDETVARQTAGLVNAAVEIPEVTGSSYVEWVRAFAVTTQSPGRYRVEVAYRLLVASGGGFSRNPVGAVAVELSVGGDGAAALLSLPELVAVPELVGLERPEYVAEYPPEVVTAAVGNAAVGDSAALTTEEIVGVYGDDAAWYVVANVKIGPGLVRPLVIAVAR